MYNLTGTTIEFIYPIAEIESQLSMQSSYGAKNMAVPATGEDSIDAYGLSADERDFIDVHLAGTIASLFSLFVGQSVGIDDAVFTKKEVGEPHTVCCGFTVKQEVANGRLCFNENRLPIIDESCQKYIVCSILLEWAKTNKITDDVSIHQNAVNDTIRQIIHQYTQIKKGRYGKTFNITQQ